MNKTLSVERLYTLGDYKNIKLGDIITDIPEELANDRNIIDKLRFLQFLDLELAYRRYLKLAEKFQSLSIEDAIDLIEDIRVNTFKALTESLEKEEEK